ncbi:CU044_5270 family protein [Conexibacter arvalis]|uniref:CU044_5270 family protein n=1 Tax=Conexibacter arvalis TaxID=912552 RepID=A0A840IGL0_9ACTN|nr:CU044_5270 family protein [Conexibacter arvalis]MBB4663475.1 hypothetical protein [Conexibacter arvalis]
MEVLDELERRFAAAIEAEGREAAGEGPRARPRRARRRIGPLPRATAGALAALAALAAVVLVVAAGGGGGDGTGEERVPAASIALLERVADAAEQAPPPPVLRDGEVWYVREEGIDQWGVRGPRSADGGIEMLGVRRLYSIERWSGFGQVGRTRSLTVRTWFPFRGHRERWLRSHRRSRSAARPTPPDADVAFARVTGLPLDTGLLTPAQVRALPSDPAALLDAIEQAVRARGSLPAAEEFGEEKALAAAQFVTIRSLLALPVTPRQRAGLLRAFVLLPGARVYGMGRDRLGRPGLVLTFLWRNRPEHVVVRARDGRLLETRGPRGGRADTVVAEGVARNVRSLPDGVAAPKERLPRTRWTDAPRLERPGLP